METSNFTDISVDKPSNGALLIRLSRPDVHNALRTQLLKEIADTLEQVEEDETIGAVVITGSEKVFAAGADIREMANLDTVGLWKDKRPTYWKRISRFSKPILASVNGFCLGGGFELAMHADIVIAGANAQFGQPEINLGIMPGAGGTQRLVRAVGKSVAMKLILSGEFIDANMALQCGIAAEVCQPELTLERTLNLAATIAAKSPIATKTAKEAVLKAFETPLEQGLDLERKAFLFLAATADRSEGINAFLEKRKPEFKGN